MEALELCRLCALEKDNLLGIFDSEGIRLTLDEKIKKCLHIEVSEKKNFPKSICLDCYSKLDAFEEFLECSINAQATLSILYPDKPQKIVDLGLSDEDDKNDSDDEYGGHEGSFILGNVGSQDELDISGTEMISAHSETEKTYSEPPAGSLDHCSSTDVASDILDAVGQDFLSDKSDVVVGKIEQSEAECRPDEDRKIKKEEWEHPTIWLCSDCSEQFANVDDLRQHHKTDHKQDPRYMCDFCSKLFSDYQTFTAHLKRHKSSLKYSCDVCNKVFSNKKHVDAHMHVHSNSRPYHCAQCGKSFRQQSALMLHTRCHLPEEMKNWYPCEMCDKKFSTKPNLVTHMRIHSGVRNFTCDQCGKSFIQKGNLDAHLLTHSQDKPFECEVCGKKFKTTMQLRKHHSVHTGAKPHSCDVCGRNFREKGTLREHHRIHTGAMPFTCEFCGKAFRFKGILTTHRRQHTGERPYSCLECQHHFTNWPNYNKHMKRRHGINTSRTARTENKFLSNSGSNPQHIQQVQQQVEQLSVNEDSSPPVSTPQLYQEIQSADLYANIQTSGLSSALPTYMAYNVYSLSNMAIDGTSLEIMPRQTITLKEAVGGTINFQT